MMKVIDNQSRCGRDYRQYASLLNPGQTRKKGKAHDTFGSEEKEIYNEYQISAGNWKCCISMEMESF